ncbi:S-layer homology domain-containing protein [Solibacillus silvestris]|uniref:S-layer homology domain-containing protein n=1 Tax=Solibacillus silvestris TaxID=76853 RepID=UPI003F82030A
MTNKSLKIFTATAIAATVVAPAASASTTFKDITSANSHYEAIQLLVERGVISGYEDGTFRPNAALTRGQAAKILASVLNLDTSSTNEKFKDVTSKSGYIGAINALADAGIINGYEDGTFKPNAPLTRGQMAKILVNAFNLSKSTALTHQFKDVSEANGYSYDIQTLVDYAITEGTSPTTYAPTEAVKRGQMATFVVKAEKANTAANGVVSLHIDTVSAGILKTAEGEFAIDSSLAGVLSEANNEALANAVVKATIKDNRITAMESLQINASGSAEKAVVLDGQNNVVDGSITIAGDFVEVKNLTVTKDIFAGGKNQTSLKLNNVKAAGTFNIEEEPSKMASIGPVANKEIAPSYQIENSDIKSVNIARNLATLSLTGTSAVAKLSVASNVQEIKLDGKFGEVVLNASSEMKVTGNATISKVVVAAGNANLDITGSVASLEITNPNIKITLNPNAKISNLTLPAGAEAASVITNYSAVRANIEAVNNASANSNSNTNSGSGATIDTAPGGGTVITPTNPTEPGKPAEPSTPEVPKLPEQPLDPGNEQLEGNKPEMPTGDFLTGKISEIIVSTPDAATVTSGESSNVTTADTVKIKLSNSAKTYIMEGELASFFKHNKNAISGADATVVLNGGNIIAIRDLTLNASTAPVTLLDGGAITIYGNLKVLNNQIEKLTNIVVGGNLILSADRTQNLEIDQTKVFGKVEFETPSAQAMRSRLASIAPFAAATTRIKITFTDSTVAIIEVRKEDVELHTGGTTEVANIRLFANADITSSLTNGKILPKIVIGQGVTNVKLNASIANVVIESDEDVIVGGEGNFDNVVVNTNKEVAINTVGTIGNLDIKKDEPKIKLGEEVQSVGTVTTILPVTEVFQNYEEMKGKVGQVVLPNVDFFAAELIRDDENMGYFKIKLAAVGNYKVKYHLVDIDKYWEFTNVVRNVDKVPAAAKDYKVGEQIFIPANKKLFVYTVDETNTIKDFKHDFSYGASIRFTSTETGTKIESTFDVMEGSKVSDVYEGIFNFNLDQPILYLGTTTIELYTWKKEGDYVTFFVPGTDKFTLAEENDEQRYFGFEWNVRKMHGQGYGGGYGGHKATALKVIKEVYRLSETDPAPAEMLAGPINLAFYAELNIKENIAENSNVDNYRTVVKGAKTLEELYDSIIYINEKYNAIK